MSVVTKGAIMQFERANNLPVDGIAGPEVWKALFADQLQNKVSPWPYTYISVTESQPETLELWSNNQLVMKTLANTGIPATPTYLGTFPVYERLKFQIMRGKNPNGVPYADPVYWINYFKGGDAVHGFVRASYGFPQSLGCVEVPPSVAQKIYAQVHYGTLVTVNPVGVPPAPPATNG
nr:L,D-transpeptidase family protein [Sulfobacillus harzensis]